MSTQTIFRVAGRNRSYTKLSNVLLADQHLSLECKGMLVSILMLPVAWEFNVEWLRRQFGLGRDKAYKLVNEARERGYCRRIEHRSHGGSIDRVEYHFSDDPDTFDEKPQLPENTEVGEQLPDQPLPANTGSGKSGSIERTIEEKKELIVNPLPPSGASPKGDAAKRGSRLPDGFVVPDDWREWARCRAPRFAGMVDHEAEKFADHFLGNGKAMKDWPATWRNWWRRAVERAPRNLGLIPTARERKALEDQDFLDLIRSTSQEALQ